MAKIDIANGHKQVGLSDLRPRDLGATAANT